MLLPRAPADKKSYKHPKSEPRDKRDHDPQQYPNDEH
jgi:hypothetical protein